MIEGTSREPVGEFVERIAHKQWAVDMVRVVRNTLHRGSVLGLLSGDIKTQTLLF